MISDNGQYLYTALNGGAAVRRVDLASQIAGLQFQLGSNGLNEPLSVEDMAAGRRINQPIAGANIDGGTNVWTGFLGAVVNAPSEVGPSQPLTGLGAGDGLIVVPASNLLVAYLNQANGDYIAAEMVKAFISSSEYRQRFGP